MKKIIEKGDFDIMEGELFQHLAKFCEKSMDQGREDIARAWAQHESVDDDHAVPSQDSDKEAGDTVNVVDGHDNVIENSTLAVA
jgi:hypothetical protein